MNRELQDFTWVCLSKKAREEIKGDYLKLESSLNHLLNKEYLSNEECDRVETIKGKKAIYKMYFGHHNLTSDTEPEEMLIKSRAKIIDLYAKAENEVSFGSEDLQLWGKHCMEILDALFGNKCLPDTPNTPNSGELKSDKDISKMEISTTEDDKELEHRLEQPSVQVEPKKYFESKSEHN